MKENKIKEIVALLRELNFDEFRKPIKSNETLDGLLQELTFFVENEKRKKNKIDTIVDHLLYYSVGNFQKPIPISDEQDQLDVISLQINTFVEELAAHSVNINTFNNVFNTIQAPFFIINIDEHCFTNVNKAAINYFGYKKTNRYKIDLAEILPDIIIEKISEFHKGSSLNASIEGVFQVKNANRNIIIDLAKLDYTSNNKSSEIVMMMFDNTDQYQKINLENKLKLKDEFLANMSHEIRTPLNAIVGLINLLSRSSNLSPKQIRYMDIITLNSKSLMDLINSILDYSKMEAGKLELEMHPFNLKIELQKIVQSQKHTANQKGIDLKLKLPKQFVSNIIGDAVRLKQIIVNLLSNAIKFTNKGYVSLIVTKELETRSTIKYKFVIKDTGIGIAKDKQALIFESFTQLNSTTNEVMAGTGLGLSIVKKLVELYGSSIHLKSAKGKGAEFAFTICFHKKSTKGNQVNPINCADNQNNLFKGLKILLVEDNEFNRVVALDTIADVSPEIKVDIAENGRKAIAKLKTKNYNIILMDLKMPEIDGYQTISTIRHDLKLNTPIIVMTSYNNIKNLDSLKLDDVDYFITKPFDDSELRDKMLCILRSAIK